VVSRTQRYDFRPVQPSGMLDHLQSVAQAESMQIDDDALTLIAELSGGGFRDALSLLDQIGSTQSKVSRQLVAEVAGIGDEAVVCRLIVTVGQGDLNGALSILEELWNSGAEPTLLVEHILLIARKQFLKPSKEDDLSREQLARLLAEFTQAARELKTVPIPTLPLELAVWRLSTESSSVVSEGSVAKSINVVPPRRTVKATVRAQDLPEAVLGADKITAKALSLIKSKNNSLYAVLRSGDPTLQGDRLLIRCRFRFHKERIEEPKNQQFIEAVFTKVANRPIEMIVQHATAEPAVAPAQPEEELVASAIEILGGEVVQD